MEVLVKLAQRQSQTEGTELPPCYLSWWKYLCKWLVGPHSYSLQPQSHHHGTLFGESTCESCLSVHDSHRAISMLLILVEVSVNVACWSTTATDWRHKAIFMLLILVEVSVWVACRLQTAATAHKPLTQSHHHATYPGGSTCASGLSVYDSHKLQLQSYLTLGEQAVLVRCVYIRGSVGNIH